MVNYIYSSVWFLPLRVLFSLLYSLVIFIRNKFYDLGIYNIHRLRTPVVSVGNLSVGGSGKTILIQTLLDFFLLHNMKPAVLSRGYARKSKGPLLVSDGNSLLSTVADSGDEPFLIAKNFPGVPVFVSGDRVLGAKKLEAGFQPDVILLDDGFQHRRLHRDIDIVMVDKPEHQKTHMLPWGDQREPASSLIRASIIIHSKAGLLNESDTNLEIEKPGIFYDHNFIHYPLSDLNGTYGLFAGLGNSRSFFDSIQSVLDSPVITLSFTDHVEYGEKELELIEGSDCGFWITTQKDYVKLSEEFCQANKIYFVKAFASLPIALEGLLKQYFKL